MGPKSGLLLLAAMADKGRLSNNTEMVLDFVAAPRTQALFLPKYIHFIIVLLFSGCSLLLKQVSAYCNSSDSPESEEVRCRSCLCGL